MGNAGNGGKPGFLAPSQKLCRTVMWLACRARRTGPAGHELGPNGAIRPKGHSSERTSMKPIFRRLTALSAGVAAGVFAVQAFAADMTGAGATFPYPIYAKWAEAYKAKTGIGLNYQSIGSGGGIAQIKAKTVDFGASDKPLSPADLDTAGLTQFPTVIGGVVPVVNIPGIDAGQLVLDGKTLADIC